MGHAILQQTVGELRYLAGEDDMYIGLCYLGLNHGFILLHSIYLSVTKEWMFHNFKATVIDYHSGWFFKNALMSSMMACVPCVCIAS